MLDEFDEEAYIDNLQLGRTRRLLPTASRVVLPVLCIVRNRGCI